MAALRHGLPMLCFPLGRDQFVNAEWVCSRRLGRTLPADADVETITETIKQLLEPNAPERVEAAGMRRVFADCGGADAAVQVLDETV
jgi:UDP:flavonoid glycosyltransferase YjiC (YdhE family)